MWPSVIKIVKSFDIAIMISIFVLLLLLSIVFSHVVFILFTQFAYSVLFPLLRKCTHSPEEYAQGLPSNVHETNAHFTNSAEMISVELVFVQPLLGTRKQAYRYRSLAISAKTIWKEQNRSILRVFFSASVWDGIGVVDDDHLNCV